MKCSIRQKVTRYIRELFVARKHLIQFSANIPTYSRSVQTRARGLCQGLGQHGRDRGPHQGLPQEEGPGHHRQLRLQAPLPRHLRGHARVHDARQRKVPSETFNSKYRFILSAFA